MQLVERRSLNYSIILHVAAVFMMLVGIPILLPAPPDPTPMVMSVELLPISEISNVKPSDKPIQKEQNAPAKPVKTPPTPPAPTPPQPKADPKPVSKPDPTPEPKPFDPMEGAEPVKEKKPKETPKEEPKADDDLAKLLDKLKKEQETKPAEKTAAKPTPAPAVKAGTDKTTVAENKTKSDAPYDPGLPMSMSEKDAMRSQFIPCWRAPIGSKDAASLAVRVKVELQQDGTVKDAFIAPDQQSRYNSDTFFRAAADAAVRAVHKCSPLKGLPADKFGTWGNTELNFDPKDMI